MKRGVPELAFGAVGLGGRGDDPTLSAVDTLLVDVEILRCTVRMAESAVDRFLDRLHVVRALHRGQAGANLEAEATQ